MSAAFDARQLGTVCIQVNEDGSSSDQTPQAPHAHDDCCGLCQLVNGPPAVLHPALIGLSNPPALYRLITRDVAESKPPALLVGEQQRARAPPTFS